MRSLIGRVFGGDGLEGRLDDYPIFAPPHPGDGYRLTSRQRSENLNWFLSVRSDRIAMLSRTLSGLGLELNPPSADDVDAAPLSRALDRLNKTHLSKARGMETICAPNWRDRSPTARDARLLSLVLDIGLHVGECAVHADGYEWRIDDTPYRPADRMPSEGNVVLSRRSTNGPQTLHLDVLDWTVYAVWQIAQGRHGKAPRPVNTFSFLEDLTSGRY